MPEPESWGVCMTSTATTTQINIRIGRELKDEGDASLLAAGFTPSEAIRALWNLAVRFKDVPQKLRDALLPQDASEREDVMLRRKEMAERARAGAVIVENARLAAGISADVVAEASSLDYGELYAEALFDRYEQRGLLR